VAFDEYLQKHGMEQLHPVIRSIFQASSGFDAVRAYKDTFDLDTYKRRAMIQFREIDVLVVPSTVAHFTVAEIDEDSINRNKLMGSFTHFVNLLDLCAISVPSGSWKNPKGNDMPFGITLIAEAGRDEELMGLGNSVVELFQENPITAAN
jgi:Asp-tRNA(Asn)/Glu-tRNA(Gln) amidotransferase A subunit family amidase